MSQVAQGEQAKQATFKYKALAPSHWLIKKKNASKSISENLHWKTFPRKLRTHPGTIHEGTMILLFNFQLFSTLLEKVNNKRLVPPVVMTSLRLPCVNKRAFPVAFI